ncbi:MAG: DMT family transporter [Candidatus Cloacimonadota bacterium]|nr:DMT family transporter [Candidatus Cloacimonadota bacterium]
MKAFKSELLLLTTAIIWGFSFVAQRIAMEFLEPLLFNGIRFLLGAVSLLPIILFLQNEKFTKQNFFYGLIAGFIIFVAALLQQIGIKFTTAGKAGFITGLYVILVPIIGIALKRKTPKKLWLSSLIAIVGLYLITQTDNSYILKGDFLVFIGAFFWALHVLFMDKIAKNISIITIAFFQFSVAAILNLTIGFLLEDFSFDNIMKAKIPLLYGGISSIGIAFTLQIFGQRKAHPSHAAVILSLEGAFAVLGGWLILHETLSLRGIVGCSLMLFAIILPQILKKEKATEVA